MQELSVDAGVSSACNGTMIRMTFGTCQTNVVWCRGVRVMWMSGAFVADELHGICPLHAPVDGLAEPVRRLSRGMYSFLRDPYLYLLSESHGGFHQLLTLLHSRCARHHKLCVHECIEASWITSCHQQLTYAGLHIALRPGSCSLVRLSAVSRIKTVAKSHDHYMESLFQQEWEIDPADRSSGMFAPQRVMNVRRALACTSNAHGGPANQHSQQHCIQVAKQTRASEAAVSCSQVGQADDGT